MKNKYIKIGVLVFVVILFVGCCKRIAEVKRMYPQSSTVEVKFNTEYKDDNGISYKVKNVEYMSEREFIDKYGTNFDVPGDREQKILLVDMMLSNSNIVEAEYELSNFYIESSCYVNGVCLDSFGEMNNCGMVGKLMCGENKEVKLLYTIEKYSFSDKQWDDLTVDVFYMVCNYYPKKVVLELR